MSEPDPDSELQELSNPTAGYSRYDYANGEISGMLKYASIITDLETNPERFSLALDEQWPIVYWKVTSGAHDWQIENTGEEVTLSKQAYPEDIENLVFENGWIFYNGAKWINDSQLRDAIAGLKDEMSQIHLEVENRIGEALNEYDDVRHEIDSTGEPMGPWFVHEEAGVAGRDEDIFVFAEGYEQAKNEYGLTDQK